MALSNRAERLASLKDAMQSRILVTEGAMGTMIQGWKLGEEDYRGPAFCGHDHSQKGNNDLLNLSRPDVIEAIHREYLDAGADIIETNTISTTWIAQADYGMESEIAAIARSGAELARKVADARTAETPDRPRFVFGNLGPTNRTCSISPHVEDPGYRGITFDQMRAAYVDQARALIEGDVDALLIETIFDTLNAKAAIHGILDLAEEMGEVVPIVLSATITDLSGRNLCGQTVAAFWQSVKHAEPLAVGLNCGFGAEQLRGHVAELARIADVPIIAYPNAGLPNELGGYDEEPDTTGAYIREWAEAGLINITGGCCGTTPGHIAAIARAVEGIAPRKVPAVEPRFRLSGLDVFAA